MIRPQFGVVSLSCDFLGHLQDPSVRDRIAPLQLGGRLEGYLVKEFMQFVYWRSKGSRFCEGNRGTVESSESISHSFDRPPSANQRWRPWESVVEA